LLPVREAFTNQKPQSNKDQLIHSLRTHRVNTITELRRIEKIFAYLDSAEGESNHASGCAGLMSDQ